MQATGPFCFVIMPFATKIDPVTGLLVDFDRIYETAIAPGARDVGLRPIRADQERTGGLIHKPMFQRLLRCEFAIADLTAANPNVLYELGVRHACRPRSTLTLFAGSSALPFDVKPLRSMPYSLGTDGTFGADEAVALRTAIGDRLRVMRESAANESAVDSPFFELIPGWRPVIPELRIAGFWEDAHEIATAQEELAVIRAVQRENPGQAADRLADLRVRLGPAAAIEHALLFDLLVTYRALGDWEGVVRLTGELPAELRDQPVIQERLAFALNRKAGSRPEHPDRDRALMLLQALDARQQASSETHGLVGRIYKDAWKATRATRPLVAAGQLGKAIDSYRRGMQADMRDLYSGINLVTLLNVRGDEVSLGESRRVLPVVRYAAQTRLSQPRPSYWTHATLLELAVLDADQEAAHRHAADALAEQPEGWEATTTADNLDLVAEIQAGRGAQVGWLAEIGGAFRTEHRVVPGHHG